MTAQGEFEFDGGRLSVSAVFDGEREFAARATQIQAGVASGMELGRAAQRLAGTHAGDRFGGVVNENYSEPVVSL